MAVSQNIFSAAMIYILFVLLVAAVVMDLKSHRIPNILLAPALSLAILLHTMNGGVDGLIVAIGGLAVGLVIFMPHYVIGGMGAGDIKLLGVVGSFLGPWGALVAGLATMMAGAVFGVIAICWRRARPAIELQAAQLMSPHAGAAQIASLIHSSGPQQKLTYFAYAPAIAAGTAFALWYLGYLPEELLEWAK